MAEVHPIPTTRGFVNRLGHRVGRLVVIGYAGRIRRMSRWLCRCDCGRTAIVSGAHLNPGYTQSCGCLRREAGRNNRKHGLSQSRTHSIWSQMKKRTRSPDSVDFHRYGARGIDVCERWLAFENFLADMGECPPKKTLERINNDGNYGPGNCRWATRTEQARNTRTNRLITFRGETRPAAAWAEITGLKSATIRWRLSRGWSVERALTMPCA